MQTCKNCGNEIAENNNFCGNCGMPVTSKGRKQDDLEADIPIQDIGETKNTRTFQPKKSSRGKRLFLIPILIVLVILVYTQFSGTTNPFVKTVDISDFIHEPSYTGNDSEGVIDYNTLYLDKNMLEQELESIVGEDKNININQMMDDFVLTADPVQDLSNGDTVTIVVEMRNKENYQNDLGVRFTNPNRNYQVIGLNELFDQDPFDGFQPVFSGISPKLRVELKNTKLEDNSPLEEFLGFADQYYDVYRDGKLLEDDTDLEIGDVLTFTFNEDGVNELHNNAYKPTTLEREYTITTADAASYIVSKDELKEEFFEEIRGQADSIIKAFLASREITEPYEYEGMHFLTPKAYGWQREGWGDYKRPMMYLVYSYNATKESIEPESRKFKAVKVINFVNEKTEKPVLESEEAITPNQYVDYSDISLVSTTYEDVDSLFLNLVESEVEYYTYESEIR